MTRKFFVSLFVLINTFVSSSYPTDGDLQPRNVMIDNTGHILIKSSLTTKYLSSPTCGTSRVTKAARPLSVVSVSDYQAPEILLGWAHDLAVDCWSFGLLLCLMLEGNASSEVLNGEGVHWSLF